MIVGQDEFFRAPEGLLIESRPIDAGEGSLSIAPGHVRLSPVAAATLAAALSLGVVSPAEAMRNVSQTGHCRLSATPGRGKSAPLSEAIREILAAKLQSSAAVSAMKLATGLALGDEPPEFEAIPLDDEGLSLEFNSKPSLRQIGFIVSGDGARVPFLARGPDGFRQAGILVGDDAIGEVREWLAGGTRDFPRSGVELP